MFYKCNFIGFENVMGLVWVICGYMMIVYEDVLLWYEWDIFYFFVEWIILLDIMILVDYILI